MAQINVTLLNYPDNTVEWAGEWVDNSGFRVQSGFVAPDAIAIITDPSMGLTGKFYAWIWRGAGEATRYGPWPKLTVVDGGTYIFDFNAPGAPKVETIPWPIVLGGGAALLVLILIATQVRR